MAGGAPLIAGDFDSGLGAPDRLPEADVEAVFEIGAFFRLLFGGGSAARAAPTEELAEDIAEGAAGGFARLRFRRPARPHVIGEIEAAEIHVGVAPATAAAAARSAGAREAILGVETDLIVHLPFLRVAQNVIGFLDVLETIFGRLVARVEIGVVFAGKLTVSLADFIFGSAARHAESFVVIVFWSRRHSFQRTEKKGRTVAGPPAPPFSFGLLLLLTSCRRRRRIRRPRHRLYRRPVHRTLRFHRPAGHRQLRGRVVRPADRKLICTLPRPVCGWPA